MTRSGVTAIGGVDAVGKVMKHFPIGSVQHGQEKQGEHQAPNQFGRRHSCGQSQHQVVGQQRCPKRDAKTGQVVCSGDEALVAWADAEHERRK